MDILIVGGSGYIGRNLVKFLADSEHNITVVSRNLSRKSEQLKSHNIKYLQFDIFAYNGDDLYKKLGSPSVLLHLAWESGFIHNAPSHLNNIMKHVSFLETMIKGGLTHLSILGTMHEIGCFVGQVDEHTPTNPHNAYGIAKNFLRQAMEVVCSQYNVYYQWLRVFYIYGDDIRNNSIFSKILKACEEGKESFDLNSGELLYDFTHIDKLAYQIASVITQTEISGIINCCTGDPISLKTMVNNFVENNKLPIKIQYNKFPLRQYDSRAIWGSNEKINLICSKTKTNNRS